MKEITKARIWGWFCLTFAFLNFAFMATDVITETQSPMTIVSFLAAVICAYGASQAFGLVSDIKNSPYRLG